MHLDILVGVFSALRPTYKVNQLKNSKFALLAKWYILIL